MCVVRWFITPVQRVLASCQPSGAKHDQVGCGQVTTAPPLMQISITHTHAKCESSAQEKRHRVRVSGGTLCAPSVCFKNTMPRLWNSSWSHKTASGLWCHGMRSCNNVHSWRNEMMLLLFFLLFFFYSNTVMMFMQCYKLTLTRCRFQDVVVELIKKSSFFSPFAFPFGLH